MFAKEPWNFGGPTHTHTCMHPRRDVEGLGTAPHLPIVLLHANLVQHECACNCTDMFEHDCACLTCKTYHKSWPQAALSSAHADHFLRVQVRPADQAGYPIHNRSFIAHGRLWMPCAPAYKKHKTRFPLEHRVAHTHVLPFGSSMFILAQTSSKQP